MNGNLAFNVILGAMVTVITIIVNARMNSKNLAQTKEINAATLAAARPKSEAEVIDLGIDAVNKVTAALREHISRQDAHIDKQDGQLRDFSRRLEAIDSDLQDAHEQNDLLAAELAEERKKNRLLAASLETAQAQLKAALAELDTTRRQIRVLIEHAKLSEAFWIKHFNENGHADSEEKPPKLLSWDSFGID